MRSTFPNTNVVAGGCQPVRLQARRRRERLSVHDGSTAAIGQLVSFEGAGEHDFLY